MEQTLILIKPDAVHDDVWLNIIKTYEARGLQIVETRIMSPMPLALAQKLYAEHAGKDFYKKLLQHMTDGTTIALKVVGDNAIALAREINGATNPSEALPGTIRYEYGSRIFPPANAVHASAHAADAKRELALFFSK